MCLSFGVTDVLLIVVGLILVGLPLLAVAADRVLPPPRRRPPPPPDSRDELRRRFGLTWRDTQEVDDAVRHGRATRAELQPAARSFAELVLAPPTFRGRPITSYPKAARRLVQVLLIVVFMGLLHCPGHVPRPRTRRALPSHLRITSADKPHRAPPTTPARNPRDRRQQLIGHTTGGVPVADPLGPN